MTSLALVFALAACDRQPETHMVKEENEAKWEIILSELSAIMNEERDRETAYRQAETACKAEQNSHRTLAL